jgi:hypothetical protein
MNRLFSLSLGTIISLIFAQSADAESWKPILSLHPPFSVYTLY